MIETLKENDEVLYPKESIITVGALDLDTLKQMAKLNPRHRIRLCAHQTAKDEIHEMIIYHSKGTYVQPHMHIGKDESFHLICGEIDCVIFDNQSNVKKAIPMGNFSSGKTFFYRIPANTYHTQIFKKDTFFHEVTKGPFNRNETVTATWAPCEKETAMVKSYLNEINQIVKSINS